MLQRLKIYLNDFATKNCKYIKCLVLKINWICFSFEENQTVNRLVNHRVTLKCCVFDQWHWEYKKWTVLQSSETAKVWHKFIISESMLCC